VLVAVYLVPASGNAQIVDEFKPPAGTCCLPSAAQKLADQLQDWKKGSQRMGFIPMTWDFSCWLPLGTENLSFTVRHLSFCGSEQKNPSTDDK